MFINDSTYKAVLKNMIEEDPKDEMKRADGIKQEIHTLLTDKLRSLSINPLLNSHPNTITTARNVLGLQPLARR